MKDLSIIYVTHTIYNFVPYSIQHWHNSHEDEQNLVFYSR